MPLVLRLSVLAVASTLALAAQATDFRAAAQVDADLQNPALRYKADQVIVQYRAGVGASHAEAALAALGAKPGQMLRAESRRHDGLGDLRLASLPANMSVSQAIQHLRQDPAVEFAEPNWILTKDAKGIDPYYSDGSLWGMYGASSPIRQNQYGSGAGTAFKLGKKCKGTVIVGIIDEGMMPNHPDTEKNVWTNPYEIAGNGIDDDGNGYIDDVNGWDFFNNDKTPFDGVGDDHATHVSGTIGAVGNNAIGVAGMCSRVQMISAKFLGPAGGSTSDAVLAVDYITDLKTLHDMNIVATNNSWGGGGFAQSLQNAIDRAGDAEILFIAAAGNDGMNIDNSPHYPASYPNANIISVAALTFTGTLASFSNYGVKQVDLGAPGAGIFSTVPVQSGGQVVGGYASYSGTSMATPHVTGAAVLWASLHAGQSAMQIKDAILAHTIPTTSLAGKTATGGRLDVSGF
jgi:subtilisin family serine protease